VSEPGQPSRTADLRPLLAAVRRHLWAGRFVATFRQALWGGSALLLLLALVHLVWQPVPAGAALAAVALPWGLGLMWAAARPPRRTECALWADRRLGGASAFTTLLEARAGRLPAADARAVGWLEQWAGARLPSALQRLAAERCPLRLVRPAAVAGVCAALATVVLILPGRDSTSTPSRALAASAAAAAAASDAPAESQTLVSEVAQALRAPGRRDAARRQERPGADEVVPGSGATAPGSAAAGRLREAGADARAAGSGAPRPTHGDSARVETAPPGGIPSAAAAGALGGSTGREAGSSRDARTNAAVSAVPRGTMPTQRVELASARPGAGVASPRSDAQGDAQYDGAAAPDRGRAAPAAAPATPPTAAPAMALTPAQTRYVQAWTHARATR
jgi:hypothetical protein